MVVGDGEVLDAAPALDRDLVIAIADAAVDDEAVAGRLARIDAVGVVGARGRELRADAVGRRRRSLDRDAPDDEAICAELDVELGRVLQRDLVQREARGADDLDERGVIPTAVVYVPRGLRASDLRFPALAVDRARADDSGVRAMHGDERGGRAVDGGIARPEKRGAGVDPERDPGRQVEGPGTEGIVGPAGGQLDRLTSRAAREGGLDA